MSFLFMVSGLLCIGIISVSSGVVYVRSGEDITECGMMCSEPDEVTWELFAKCRGKDKLLVSFCDKSYNKSYDLRIHLDPRNTCWKLTSANKNYTCVYEIWRLGKKYNLSSTDIRVIDPIVIYNITNNGSRLGQDVAVSINFTGEESAVTWEVDGEPLPERYRLIDDNRTLIIPGVQRGDTQRTFRVTITNPVSNETRSYQLNSTLFFEELETKDSDPYRRRTGLIGVVIIVLGLSAFIIYQICSKKKRNINDPEDGAGATLKDGSWPVTPPQWISALYKRWLCVCDRISTNKYAGRFGL